MNPKIQLAGCVVRDDYGRILLLHRSSGDYSQWELPGGKLEEGETAEAAAIREWQEELGVDVRLVKSLGSTDFTDGDRDFHYAWFEAVIERGEPSIQEPDTFDDMDYFELEDLMSLALSVNMIALLQKIVSGEVAFDA